MNLHQAKTMVIAGTLLAALTSVAQTTGSTSGTTSGTTTNPTTTGTTGTSGTTGTTGGMPGATGVPSTPGMGPAGTTDMGTTDTTSTTSGTGTISTPTSSAMTADTIRRLQTSLNEEGASLTIDGRMGPLTREALRRYQTQNNLAVTGNLDSATMDALGLSATDRAPSSIDQNTPITPEEAPMRR